MEDTDDIGQINVIHDNGYIHTYTLDVYKNPLHPAFNIDKYEQTLMTKLELNNDKPYDIYKARSVRELKKMKAHNRRLRKKKPQPKPKPKPKPQPQPQPSQPSNIGTVFSLDTTKFTVLNQGNLGSCVVNSTAACFEYMFKSNNINTNFQPLSRLYTYFTARGMDAKIDNFPNYLVQDCGLYVNDGLNAIKSYGYVSENTYPYNVNIFAYNPDLNIYQGSKVLKSLKSVSLGSRLNNITILKTTLSAGFPVLCGILVYQNFGSSSVTKTGDVPMPSGSLLGGHCILLIGFNDITSRVTFLNSWGTGWGNKGYGTIPYAYLTSTNASDFVYISQLII